MLHKTIRVETNDKRKKRFNLEVSGPVERFVTIAPARVRLHGEVGVPLEQTVDIIPEKKYPFKILSHKAREGKNITYTLKEIDKNGNKSYRITINNTLKEKGRYADRIILTTDSKIQPEMIIYVSGFIFEKRKSRNRVPDRPKS